MSAVASATARHDSVRDRPDSRRRSEARLDRPAPPAVVLAFSPSLDLQMASIRETRRPAQQVPNRGLHVRCRRALGGRRPGDLDRARLRAGRRGPRRHRHAGSEPNLRETRSSATSQHPRPRCYRRLPIASDLVMSDDTRWMRGVALVWGVCIVGCGGAASSIPPGVDSGETPPDAIADVDSGSLDRAADTVNAGAGDATDARADGDPFLCGTVAPLVLTNPTLISGTLAAGQTVTMRITMTDTDPEWVRLVSGRGVDLPDRRSQLRIRPGRSPRLVHRRNEEHADHVRCEARRIDSAGDRGAAQRACLRVGAPSTRLQRVRALVFVDHDLNGIQRSTQASATDQAKPADHISTLDESALAAVLAAHVLRKARAARSAGARRR